MLHEVYFLLAEAALRGWAGAGDAGQNYEMGVRTSFELWGAGGVDDYLADNTSLPLDYDDPKAEGDVNDFVNRIMTTVAWDEGADNEDQTRKDHYPKMDSGLHRLDGAMGRPSSNWISIASVQLSE